MRESFFLTNICPQDHNLNCGDWNELEIACRNWANKYGDIYIVAGPILYKGKHETIGPNKVTVPEGFFKVVLCMNGTPKAIGFIYKIIHATIHSQVMLIALTKLNVSLVLTSFIIYQTI